LFEFIWLAKTLFETNIAPFYGLHIVSYVVYLCTFNCW